MIHKNFNLVLLLPFLPRLLLRLFLDVLSFGHHLVQRSPWLPTLLSTTCVIAGCQLSTDGQEGILGFWIGLASAVIASWAAIGVIAMNFTMPQRLALMYDMKSQFIDRMPKREDYRELARKSALLARMLSREDDAIFFLEAGTEIAVLDKKENRKLIGFGRRFEQLRDQYKDIRKMMWGELFVRRFWSLMLFSLVAVFAFGLLNRHVSYVTPKAFTPEVTMSYWDGCHQSFLTITNVGSDYRPAITFTKWLDVWQISLGLLYLAIIIGAAAGTFSSVGGDELSQYDRTVIKAFKRRTMSFWKQAIIYHRSIQTIFERRNQLFKEAQYRIKRLPIAKKQSRDVKQTST